MSSARAAAVVTWVCAAGFGLPVIPVVVVLARSQALPSLFGLFPVYGGPWSSRLAADALTWLLLTFLGVCLLVSWTAVMLWNGSRKGGVLNVALLAVEAVFWFGFALPGPVVLGALRVFLVARAWPSLR
ncbi:hypothetical protein [Geodermatophilus sp. SYSU D00700]